MTHTQVDSLDLVSTLELLTSFINFGRRFGFHAYKWEGRTQNFVFKPTSFWRRAHVLYSVIVCLYTAFLVYNCFHVVQDRMAPMESKVQIGYMSFTYTLFNLGFLLFFQEHGEHPAVLNQVAAFIKVFKAQYGLEMDLKPLKLIWRIAYLAYVFGAINSSASVFANPASHRLITSLLPEPRQAPKGILIAGFVFHLLLNGCVVYFAIFQAMVFVYYIYMIIPVIQKLRWGLSLNHLQIPNRISEPFKVSEHHRQMSPLQIFKTFNTLMVIQSSYTSVFGPWILMFVVGTIWLSTLNLFLGIVFAPPRTLISVLLGALLASTCRTAGELHEISTKVRVSWFRIRHPNWFVKYVKSTRAARVSIGSFFYFDRGVWPTFFCVITTTAANLIVTYRD